MKKAKKAAVQARKDARQGGCSANKGREHHYHAGEMTCAFCGAYSAERAKMYADVIIIDDTPDDAEITVDDSAGEYTPAEYDAASITVVERA